MKESGKKNPHFHGCRYKNADNAVPPVIMTIASYHATTVNLFGLVRALYMPDKLNLTIYVGWAKEKLYLSYSDKSSVAFSAISWLKVFISSVISCFSSF